MYAVKEAVIFKEHHPEAEPAIFYMDVRAHGKDFDAYVERAKTEYGVRFVRSTISRVAERPKSKNLTITFVGPDLRVQEEDSTWWFSRSGYPLERATELAGRLGLKLDDHGFCRGKEFSPLETSRPASMSVALSRGRRTSRDGYPGQRATAGASAFLADVRGTLAKKKEFPPETDVSGQAPRIGIFVCHCGINIGGVVNVPEVVAYAKTLKDVAYVEENLYTCSQDTQEKMKKAVQEHRLNGSLSPRVRQGPMSPCFRRRSGR